MLAVDETRYMRMHPAIGHSILLNYGYDQTVLNAVLYHHEHYDGSGYPQNLKEKRFHWWEGSCMYVIFSGH